jgi:hypothetical protein
MYRTIESVCPALTDSTTGSLDANEVVKIAIVQPGTGSPTELFEFPPKFTYPLFDDKERIFGYKELIVKLRFAAHDLYPHVAISFDDEFKQVGDTKATDILGILKAFLPDCKLVMLLSNLARTDSLLLQMLLASSQHTIITFRMTRQQHRSNRLANWWSPIPAKAGTLKYGAPN